MTEIKCEILEDGRVAVETVDKHKYTIQDLKNVHKNLKNTAENKKKQMESWKAEMAKGKIAIKNLSADIDEAIKNLDVFEKKMQEIGYLEKILAPDEKVEAKDDKSVG